MRFKHPDKSECSVEKLIIMDFYIITDITMFRFFSIVSYPLSLLTSFSHFKAS